MIIFDLPFPPSVNSYWRHAILGNGIVRTLLSAKGRQYQRQAVKTIRAQIGSLKTIHMPVAIELEYYRPDNRKRDLDNLQKAVLDAITHARVWLDDSLVHEIHSWWTSENTNSPGKVRVKIWQIEK